MSDILSLSREAGVESVVKWCPHTGVSQIKLLFFFSVVQFDEITDAFITSLQPE